MFPLFVFAYLCEDRCGTPVERWHVR
jgi:hypothetical protein